MQKIQVKALFRYTRNKCRNPGHTLVFNIPVRVTGRQKKKNMGTRRGEQQGNHGREMFVCGYTKTKGGNIG